MEASGDTLLRASLVPPSRSQDSLILIFLAPSIYDRDIKSFKKHSLREKGTRLRENIEKDAACVATAACPYWAEMAAARAGGRGQGWTVCGARGLGRVLPHRLCLAANGTPLPPDG